MAHQVDIAAENGPPEPVWIGEKNSTYEEALLVGEEVRADTLKLFHTLPHRDATCHYPSTMSDALSLVHARDDAKRKAGIVKPSKVKQRSLGAALLGSDDCFPGAMEGSGDQYAFWMYLEDFFRDTTQEDLHDILPFLVPPHRDPAFAMGPPGSGNHIQSSLSSVTVPSTVSKKEAQKQQHIARQQEKRYQQLTSPLVKGGASASQQQTQQEVPITPSDEPGSPSERRSRRLGSKLSKGYLFEGEDGDGLYPDDDDEEEREIQEAIAIAEAAAASAAAAMTVATTAQGTVANRLWDMLTDRRFAQLAIEYIELEKLAEKRSTDDGNNDDLLDAKTIKALAACATSSHASSARIDPGVRSRVQSWLEHRTSTLSEALGCTTSTLIVPLRREIISNTLENKRREREGREQGIDMQRTRLATGDGNGHGESGDDEELDIVDGSEANDDNDATPLRSDLPSTTTPSILIPVGAAAAKEVKLPSTRYCHPYTRLILQRPVPDHIRRQAVEPLPYDPVVAGKTPTAAPSLGVSMANLGASATADLCAAGQSGSGFVDGGRGDASGYATPTTASQQQQQDGDGATTKTKNTTRAAAVTNAINTAATPVPTLSNTTTPTTTAATNDGIGDDEPFYESRPESAGVSEGGSGRFAARQRGISNYALLAGRKDPAKAAAAAAARKLSRAATLALEAHAAEQHPVARAVADAIAAGDEEGPMSAQWDVATRDLALLAAAPQDEIAAETLALQAELASVAAANRMRLVPALRALIADIPNQRAMAELRSKEEEEIITWVKSIREARRKEIKQRREAAQREAMSCAQKGNDIMAGAVPFHHALEGNEGEEELEIPFLGPDELFDVYAQRKEEDEAFCAVCTDGSSVHPNVILFCDRCDVAVHQRCYDVDVVPENEWLCWPCREHEELMRSRGIPQHEIRPQHMLPDDRRKLVGGARDISCALCPIKLGAFRKTGDGGRWVHQPCALWHSETYLLPGNGANVVVGLNKIPQKRWQTPCDICGRTEGAVINCKHPGTCQYSFHVLCARNCGLYLTVRKDFANKPQYRIYCAMHSKAQREKDRHAFLAAQQGLHSAAQAKAQRHAENEERQAAINGIREMQREWLSMASVRDQMEKLRMLMDQCKRRERLKKQLIQATQLVHAERLTRPAQALALIETENALKQKGLTPEQILNELQGGIALLPQPPHSSVSIGAVYESGSSRAMVLGTTATTPIAAVIPATTTSTTATTTNTLEGSLPHTTGAPRQNSQSDALQHKRKRETNVNEPAESLLHSSFHVLGDGRGDSSKRHRHDTGTGISTGISTGTTTPIPVADGIIERQRVMSSSEAAEWNKKFPPEIKYVLADQLGAPSARAVRAAARTAAVTPSASGGNVPQPLSGDYTVDNDGDEVGGGAEAKGGARPTRKK